MSGLDHVALLSFLGVGTTRICELEGGCAFEVEHNLNLTSFMDIDLHHPAFTDPDSRHGMNFPSEIHSSAALASLITDTCNRKLAWRLGHTTKVSRL